MPVRSPYDDLLQSVATAKISDMALIPATIGRRFSSNVLVAQVVSDRLALAGEHLRIGDLFLGSSEYRTSISRHYYSMYHAARSIVFAHVGGDDRQGHSTLPEYLPSLMPKVDKLKNELKEARLIRNEADYDLYPKPALAWEVDARKIAVSASSFVVACSDFALENGYV